MKLDIMNHPPQIDIDLGADGVIGFGTRYMTASERMQAIRLLAVNMAESMTYCFSKIHHWTGIESATNGAPINIATEYVLVTGEKVSAVEMVLGRIPFARQIELWAHILFMNGIQHNHITLMLAEFLDAKEVDRIKGAADRFLAGSGAKPAISSVTGSSLETSAT